MLQNFNVKDRNVSVCMRIQCQVYLKLEVTGAKYEKETSLFGINYGAQTKSKELPSVIHSVEACTYGNNFTGVTNNCTIKL